LDIDADPEDDDPNNDTALLLTVRGIGNRGRSCRDTAEQIIMG
jgi:hypothetical protein